ncbi:MAG: SDR family oxidoreductase [Candidatus Binatia bacterium]|nr:SDR family oxidoreductase [Candidatus Binatia bacterium]
MMASDRELEQHGVQAPPGAALVTGVASGIGRAVAIRLLHLGWKVAGIDIDDRGTSWAEGEGFARDRWAFAQADVADPRAVDQAAAAVRQQVGRFAGLVHAAGVCTFRPLDLLDPELFDRTMAVHARGAFLCARAVIPDMRALGWGRIVNIASVAGLNGGGRGIAHYAAAKAAIVGFTKALALELGGDGITANVVAPGLIDTPLVRGAGMPQEAILEYARRAPVGRVGQPADVAAAVVYLFSPEASYVTGQVLSPNGGVYL